MARPLNILLLLVVCVVVVAYARKCYQCHYTPNYNAAKKSFGIKDRMVIGSIWNDRCKDPFNKKDVQTVECKMKCSKRTFKKGDDLFIMRTCGMRSLDGSKKECRKESGLKCCDGNKCNGGAILRASQMVLLAFLSLIFLNY